MSEWAIKTPFFVLYNNNNDTYMVRDYVIG